MSEPAVYLERGAFAFAVQACLAVAKRARDAPVDGAKVALHPSVYRIAVELREAFRRACGVEIAVQEWDELIRTASALDGGRTQPAPIKEGVDKPNG